MTANAGVFLVNVFRDVDVVSQSHKKERNKINKNTYEKVRLLEKSEVVCLCLRIDNGASTYTETRAHIFNVEINNMVSSNMQ